LANQDSTLEGLAYYGLLNKKFKPLSLFESLSPQQYTERSLAANEISDATACDWSNYVMLPAPLINILDWTRKINPQIDQSSAHKDSFNMSQVPLSLDGPHLAEPMVLFDESSIIEFLKPHPFLDATSVPAAIPLHEPC